jgi:hypothetical protein
MKTIFKIETTFPVRFDRGHAVELYRQLQTMRVASAAFIRASKESGFLYPVSKESIGIKIKDLKIAFHAEIDRRAPQFRIVRKHRHYTIGLSRLLPKGLINHEDRKNALMRLKTSLRQQRGADKHNEDILLRRKPNGVLIQYNETLLSRSKCPKDGAEYVGVEIECILPSETDTSPLMPFAKWINIGTDGSIQCKDTEEGKEIRVCIKREEIRTVIPGIMGALNSMRARVNKSCGLHVHLDQRHNTAPHLTFHKLVRSLGLLYTVVPKSRRENTFCKRNRGTSFATNDRYKAINSLAFHRHSTLEVRLFGGTLSAEKVINWVETLEAIAHGEMINRCPKNFDTAKKYWPSLTDANVAWLKERQAQFAPLNELAPLAESDSETTAINTEVYNSAEDEDRRCVECDERSVNCSCNEFVSA